MSDCKLVEIVKITLMIFMGVIIVFSIWSSGWFSEYLVLELGSTDSDRFPSIRFHVVMDSMSLLMGFTVMYISAVVMLYSWFYMSHEVYFKRFILLLGSFVMAMLLLVFVPGFLPMMIGWDFLGVISYLLVVYRMNKPSLSAGTLTFVSNRIGDACFIMGIVFLMASMAFDCSSMWSSSNQFIIAGAVSLGSLTKSAQVPFSAWLPAAMAAPTPVSTLVHSSTLVAAGVYVMLRYPDLVDESWDLVVFVCSCSTILLAGSSSVGEMDLKKVLALSTLSQVASMMLFLALGAIQVAFFHMVVHSFLKALLFMAVGSIIFYSGGLQDARLMGGIAWKAPMLYLWLVISILSLAGLPFMAGFYSKEYMIASLVDGNFPMMSVIMVMLGMASTLFYSGRVLMLLVVGSGGLPVRHISDGGAILSFSCFLLALGAVLSGVLIHNVLSLSRGFTSLEVSGFYMKLVYVTLGILTMLCLFFTSQKTWLKVQMSEFLGKMWFFKGLSGNYSSSGVLVKCSRLMKVAENGWVGDYLWGGGMKSVVYSFMSVMRSLNYNLIGVVVFTMVSCVLIFTF
uniref:NADH-ubiquinone oxidoreductase chain 5 n=1 Tax=Ectenagena elongata TaxID=1885249 RepID=A0A7M3T214_9BIVA|nr:NADH dehydrogenase subunit 5 [Ectenagena elongata]QFG38778.1 NADH dehydrogenase subunit 5 [Ectenagena elongata]